MPENVEHFSFVGMQFRIGGVLGITHLLYFGGIQLCGLPALLVGRSSAPICPCTLRVSRLIQARCDLILLGIIAYYGRYRFCLLPRVSPYASRRRSPTWWMEFPQTSGPKAAPQLTTSVEKTVE